MVQAALLVQARAVVLVPVRVALQALHLAPAALLVQAQVAALARQVHRVQAAAHPAVPARRVRRVRLRVLAPARQVQALRLPVARVHHRVPAALHPVPPAAPVLRPVAAPQWWKRVSLKMPIPAV